MGKLLLAWVMIALSPLQIVAWSSEPTSSDFSETGSL